jgi:hypothetical protein
MKAANSTLPKQTQLTTTCPKTTADDTPNACERPHHHNLATAAAPHDAADAVEQRAQKEKAVRTSTPTSWRRRLKS